MKTKTPDMVVRERCFLNVKILVKKIRSSNLELIQTDHRGFEFLGKLCAAFSTASEDYHMHFDPLGAGKVFFQKDSELGLYFDLLGKRERKPRKKLESKK
jgi:hypothetical protein